MALIRAQGTPELRTEPSLAADLLCGLGPLISFRIRVLCTLGKVPYHCASPLSPPGLAKISSAKINGRLWALQEPRLTHPG